jgi:hypothetical protein
MPDAPVRRRAAPRTRVTRPMMLARDRGGLIPCRTMDLGPGGVRVAADRPLRIDEVLAFDLDLGTPSDGLVRGEARVLREDGWATYALRFERLGAEAADALTRFMGAQV